MFVNGRQSIQSLLQTTDTVQWISSLSGNSSRHASIKRNN